jgi:hypothetical protein
MPNPPAQHGRPYTTTPQSTPYLFILLLASQMLGSTLAQSPAPTTLPQVDFSRMGTVGLGGSFSGLDWWSSDSPFASSSTSAGTAFSKDGDTLFVKGSDGSYRPLGSTNAGGVISAICWSNSTLSPTDTVENGTLIVGGTFTSISSISSPNIMAYSLTSSTFHPVSSGLSGSVNTLFCDNARGEVWVGGSFTAPVGSGGNVALWSTAKSAWETVDFGGLNGEIEDISPSADGQSVYFAGDFTTQYLTNSSTLVNTTSVIPGTNGTNPANITSIPSAPINTTTTGDSGYLTPVTLPQSSAASGGLTITAGPPPKDSAYSDPTVLVCPGSGKSTWLGGDGSMAKVDINAYSYWTARGVRLENALIGGRGTTSFWSVSIRHVEWAGRLIITASSPFLTTPSWL